MGGGVIIYLILCLGILFFKFDFSVLKNLNGDLDDTIASIDELGEIEGWTVKNESTIILESLNIDPKIFLEVNRQGDVVYVDIVVNELKRYENSLLSTNAEIYYSSDNNFNASQKVVFDLKVGHNIIKVPAPQEYRFLRIDLTDKQGLSVNIDQINITNYFKLIWFIKYFVIAFILTCIIMVILYAKKPESLIEIKVRKFMAYFMNFVKSFCNYISNNKIVVIMTFLFVFLSYGVLCAYYTIYIDEERQIIETYAEMGWIAQGRFGNYLFERFLLTGTIYTSWLGDALAAVLLGFSALISVFNYNELSGRTMHRFGQIIFCGISISLPYVCGAYMVVGIYNIEISLGLCLMAIATYFMLVNQGRKAIRYVWAGICTMISISIYQAFVPVFATYIVLGLFIKVVYAKERVIRKDMLVQIAQSVLVLGISLICYYFINKGFIRYIGGASNYLSNSFVGWGKGQHFTEIFLNILINIKLVLIGSKQLLYGGIIYRISFIVYALFIIVEMFSKNVNKYDLLFLALCSILMPFSMNFAIGNTNFAGRTLLSIPSLLGVIWIVVTEMLTDRQLIRNIVRVFAIYLLFVQLQYINQYFLADFKRYQQDQIITEQIISDIRDTCDGDTRLAMVPVGTYYHEDNDLTMSYELAGSYFTVDGGSITRIIRFMQAQGYNIDMPVAEQIADSVNYIDDMPSWPAKGSVKNINGNYVIVKLSDPSEGWRSNYLYVN